MLSYFIMALVGTHIRFAVEVIDKFKIANLDQYISGTIYPDSRYGTRIEREKTHPPDFLSWKISEIDDFEKGWYVHLLYDKIQGQAIKDNFPIVIEQGTGGQGSEYWFRLSAIKNLQCIQDLNEFEVNKYLSCLDYVRNPNGEDLEKIKRFNLVFKKAYSSKQTLENFMEVWKGVVDPETELKVEQKTLELSKNQEVMSTLKDFYPKTVKLAQEYL